MAERIPLTTEQDETPVTTRQVQLAENYTRVVDRVYGHPWRMVFRSFWSGFAYAIGLWFGSLAIVVVLGWLAVSLNLTGTIVERVQTFFLDLNQKTVDRVVGSATSIDIPGFKNNQEVN